MEPASKRPLVLLSNDDGYTSTGIRTMRDALSARADVVIVAPESEQSAASHALTLHHPLRLREAEPGVFVVNGTPADCVYVALRSDRVVPRAPDVVVSGLNHGLNLGQDVFYSGTVAAAREAALRGIPALATSAHPRADFAAAAKMCAAIAMTLAGTEPAGPRRAPLLNVNVPRAWNGELRPTRLGARIYEEIVEFRRDPRGREYFWIGGPGVRHEHDPGSDTEAYDAGAASITALLLDLTDPSYAELLTGIAAAAASASTNTNREG